MCRTGRAGLKMWRRDVKPVDSQHQIVPIFLRNAEKLARGIQNNAARRIADIIPNLSSQSEHMKNTINN